MRRVLLRMNPARLSLFALTTFILGSGCAINARPLSETPIATTRALPATQRTAKHILVVPFEDLRGAEWATTTPDRYIPVVNWFHQSTRVFYPEQAGMLRGYEKHRGFVSTGAIGAALPVVLTRVMQQMGFSDDAKVDDGKGDGTPYDYVVTGRIKRTCFRHHDSFITALTVGIFGVPFQFARYELEYEVSLYDAKDRATPLFSRSYKYEAKRNIGLYYNHTWAYPMFVAGLADTLPNVVADLATVLERAQVSVL